MGGGGMEVVVEGDEVHLDIFECQLYLFGAGKTSFGGGSSSSSGGSSTSSSSSGGGGGLANLKGEYSTQMYHRVDLMRRMRRGGGGRGERTGRCSGGSGGCSSSSSNVIKPSS